MSGLIRYFSKMSGQSKPPPRATLPEVFWSWVGGFLGISAIGWIQMEWMSPTDGMMLIGSFGATAILVYGVPSSPLAQPRNVMGGHLISALIGVLSLQFIPGNLLIAAALAVSLALAAMHLTRTVHPPGGATALIAVIGGPKIHALGYLYALIPAGLGALIMVLVALLVNNIPQHRRYPEYWL
ncbi:MAG: HPP family protein [Deltaproteobacteria bacterium]|nr:HPP family protein [Deltaproteobacteria bacterium]